MRSLSADLKGRTALVTGGRVKIGHQTVLRLLRDGAKVLVTTRFPHAAAKRLHAEPDSSDWERPSHVSTALTFATFPPSNRSRVIFWTTSRRSTF